MENPETSYKLLIEHEVRCWDAERENAARLVDRTKLLGAITAALLGLGLFKLDWFYDPDSISRIRWPWITWIIKASLGYGLIAISITFWLMFRRSRPEKSPNASWHLILQDNLLQKLPLTDQEVSVAIIDKIHRATLSLLRRNARLDERLRWAIRLFFSGVAAVIFAILLFIFFSVPPI